MINRKLEWAGPLTFEGNETVTVTSCNNCPFSAKAKEGFKCVIAELEVSIDDNSPPGWCRLRSETVLVRLE